MQTVRRHRFSLTRSPLEGTVPPLLLNKEFAPTITSQATIHGMTVSSNQETNDAQTGNSSFRSLPLLVPAHLTAVLNEKEVSEWLHTVGTSLCPSTFSTLAVLTSLQQTPLLSNVLSPLQQVKFQLASVYSQWNSYRSRSI